MLTETMQLVNSSLEDARKYIFGFSSSISDEIYTDIVETRAENDLIINQDIVSNNIKEIISLNDQNANLEIQNQKLSNLILLFNLC